MKPDDLTRLTTCSSRFPPIPLLTGPEPCQKACPSLVKAQASDLRYPARFPIVWDASNYQGFSFTAMSLNFNVGFSPVVSLGSRQMHHIETLLHMYKTSTKMFMCRMTNRESWQLPTCPSRSKWLSKCWNVSHKRSMLTKPDTLTLKMFTPFWDALR